MPDPCEIAEDLNGRRDAVRFPKEGRLYDSHSDATTQLMLDVLGIGAQFERVLIRERKAGGIARAKTRGVWDRPRPLRKTKFNRHANSLRSACPKQKSRHSWRSAEMGCDNGWAWKDCKHGS
ncbi:hypothetical protein CKJ81_08640 [Corynebacterium hadale]|uniref:Resolvase/invertase-type recombinase catalytic domain-containing protein n=1 Tax=Corynebacterium hadale TaxID=2026255 RepID=A0ABX4H8C6_9CORY|nr:hypothetical protein CKJ81_08640 [Corynebacterium hadale]